MAHYIDIFPFNGFPVAVFGLGVSGLPTALALQQSGADVRAWDDNAAVRASAAEAGVSLQDLYNMDWNDIPTLVLSPGIPLHHPEPHPVVALAQAAGCEIIGDMELLARTQRDASYVGITGTNGKSTTTALIGHILTLSGRETGVGGNVGTAALTLDALGGGGVYVLEISSYQLELTYSITFDVAVLLNISSEHLERHGGMEGYIQTKKQIFHRQTHPRSAVIGIDDEHTQKIYQELSATAEQRIIPVSGCTPVRGGVYVKENILYDDMDNNDTAVMDLSVINTMPGAHNRQNAAAAWAAARAVGVAPAVIMACMMSFPGLPHRLQGLERVDGVLYVNDSKATNAEAAFYALSWAVGRYDKVYWIAGGRSKGQGYGSLVSIAMRLAHTYLLGEAADEIAAALTTMQTHCADMKQAVREAHRKASVDVAAGYSSMVLLSPACSSFDQYDNFEARGDDFTHHVAMLEGVHEEAFDDDEQGERP